MNITGSTPEDVNFRIVVSGEDGDGRSRVVSDGRVETVIVTPLFNSVDIWQSNSVPVSVTEDNALDPANPSLEPAHGGVMVRLVTILPDEVAHSSGTGSDEALQAIGGGDSHVDGETVGLHKTDTLDVITIVSGELYAVLSDGEVLLKTGDSFIQRGTVHAWSNRTSEPASFMATMYTATR